MPELEWFVEGSSDGGGSPSAIPGGARYGLVALRYSDDASGAQGEADVVLDGTQLLTDDGLQTAMIVSLDTDARASADDALPGDANDLRGWWGDEIADVSGDRIGSKLWLLERSVLTDETLRRAETYAREALQWMVDDGLADRIVTAASQLKRGVLALVIEGYRAKDIAPRFRVRWERELSGL